MAHSLRKNLTLFARVAKKTARAYQLDAALDGLELLRQSGFVLKIPQGTGKSLVSQMIVRARLDSTRAGKTRALVIAPTIELRKQYTDMGQWFSRAAGASPGRLIGELDDSVARDADFVEAVESHQVLVTTPKFLANRLSLMVPYWNTIELCILDEVDLWSILPLDGSSVRPHRHMETIFPQLHSRGIPIVGLTATKLSGDTEKLLARFGCTGECNIEARKIGQFLPSSRITIVRCRDEDLVRASKPLTEEIGEAELNLKKATGDFETPIYLLVSIWAGRDGPARACADKVRKLWGRRTRLHEDFDEEGGGLRRTSAKQEAVAAIIKQHESVVIYGREVELVEHLGGLKIPGRSIAFAHAEDKHRPNIKALQDRDINALAMTRALGLRGLDFPSADAMVLFSAKRGVAAMDQEMCRIRGQRRHKPRKPIYLLCYSGTYEDAKVDAVVRELEDIKDGRNLRYTASSEVSASEAPVEKERAPRGLTNRRR